MNLDDPAMTGQTPPDEQNSQDATPDDHNGPAHNNNGHIDALMTRIDRRLANIAGNLKQNLEGVIDARLASLKSITEQSAQGHTPDDGDVTPEEMKVVRSALAKMPEFQSLKAELESISKRENQSRAARVEAYRNKWMDRLEKLATDAGDSFTQKDYDKMIRLLESGLEEDAEDHEAAIRDRIKAKQAERSETRRTIATDRATVRTGATERVPIKQGRAAHERWRVAQEIAASRARNRG